MNILRAVLAGLAGLICIVSVSGFITLLALRTTIMDREVAKSWLDTSKIYDGRLISALIQASNVDGEQSDAGINTSSDALKTALNATFTQDFVQTQIEGIVANAYDWTEGKIPAFTFSIPVNQKRDTLIQQLSKAIEPQIEALPTCQSAQQIQQLTCRPPDLTVEQFANLLATQSIDESGMFTTPITNESIAKNQPHDSPQTDKSLLAQLPVIRAGIDALLIILPAAVIISIAIIILATVNGRRLVAMSRLSRRIFFSVFLIFLPAIVVVWVARDSDFGLSAILTGQIGDLAIPLIKIVVVSVSGRLALFSGIACIVSVLAWIGFTIWRRKSQAIKVAQQRAVAESEAIHLPSQPPSLP